MTTTADSTLPAVPHPVKQFIDFANPRGYDCGLHPGSISENAPFGGQVRWTDPQTQTAWERWKSIPTQAFVLDVESIGLYGEAYAVAGHVASFHDPERYEVVSAPFLFACDPDQASGANSDRLWVAENVPYFDHSAPTPAAVRSMFASVHNQIREEFPDAKIFAECLFPVEAAFLTACVRDGLIDPFNQAPYPFHDVASFMAAAGMDPMSIYDRREDELPKHDPLADVRQSTRLLHHAVWDLRRAAVPVLHLKRFMASAWEIRMRIGSKTLPEVPFTVIALEDWNGVEEGELIRFVSRDGTIFVSDGVEKGSVSEPSLISWLERGRVAIYSQN